MDPAFFDNLQQTLRLEGPSAAIDRLCRALRESKDFAGLFYALLLKKRHELGVSPIPSGPSNDLPAQVHEPYEEAIREAGTLVGRLFLDEGDIPHAWIYFRMLGEPAPVAEALDRVKPGPDDDVQPLVEIAYNQGVNPRRGFDLVLERYGICSAITMFSSQEPPHPADVREYCIKQLVRALHGELCERLKAEAAQKKGEAPSARSVQEFLSEHPWLFEGDFYHIDLSHLMAVVQMSLDLPPGDELEMARDLCRYGQRLSSQFRPNGEPPFDDPYRDYGVYLAMNAGEDIEEGLAHFTGKLTNGDAEEADPRPAEVLVNLLIRLGRPAEALAVARRHLASGTNPSLTCAAVADLCRRTNDYRTLAEVAREQGDAVHFMAGLLSARTESGASDKPIL